MNDTISIKLVKIIDSMLKLEMFYRHDEDMERDIIRDVEKYLESLKQQLNIPDEY